MHGSGNLIQTLLRHNLVAHFRLLVFPLVIGSGKRLFAERSRWSDRARYGSWRVVGAGIQSNAGCPRGRVRVDDGVRFPEQGSSAVGAVPVL